MSTIQQRYRINTQYSRPQLMEHWNRLKKLQDKTEITQSFQASLTVLSASQAESFKFITAAVKKHPCLLEEASKWIQAREASCNGRGLAAFLVHLPLELRRSPSIPALWRILLTTAEESLLVEVVCVYLSDLSSDWLLSFCLRDEFFYSSSSSEALPKRLEILNELLKRRPKHPEVIGSGLIEKIGRLWLVLPDESVMRVLIKASAFIEPLPLFSVDELIAIIAACMNTANERFSKLLQFEVQKIPRQVYVLSSVRQQYCRLGAALIDFLLTKPEDVDEGLLRAILDRWNVFQCQLREAELFELINAALLRASAFKDSTVRSLLRLRAPQLYKSLLRHLLVHRKIDLLLPLTALMKESPATPREISELFSLEDADEMVVHLNACTEPGDWLKNLLQSSSIGEFVHWRMPGQAHLLAEHLRRGFPVPSIEAFEWPVEVAAELPVQDLRLLVEAFALPDARLKLLCGLPVPVDAPEISEAEILKLATLITDSEAATSAIQFTPKRSLARLILEFKATLRQYRHPHVTSPCKSFNGYLESIFPGLIDTTPNPSPLLNLIPAFMYGDTRTLAVLQSELLQGQKMFEVAAAVPVRLLLQMNGFGEKVLEGAWGEVCEGAEVARQLDERSDLRELKEFYFCHVQCKLL